MLKGIIVGVGIMVVCLMIPIVHFISGPLGPFIAGYFGVSYADESDGPDASIALRYGIALAAASVLPLVLVVAVIIAVAQALDWLELSSRLIAGIGIGLAIFILYTGSMACLGAMFARLRRRSRQSPAAAS